MPADQPCYRGLDCYKTHDAWGFHVFQDQEYYMSDTTTQTESNVGEVFDLTGTLSEEDAKKVAEAIDRIRPLDGEQKNNLLQILNEDYTALRRQVQKAFHKARLKATAEVSAQFPEPESQTDRFRIEVEELVKAQEKEMRKLVKRAKKEGVTIEDSYYGRMNITERIKFLTVTQPYDWTERDQAISEAHQPIDRAEQAALNEIERIQYEASRQIRLSAVSKDASEILSTLPKVEDVTAKLDEAVRVAHEEIAAEKALAEAAKPKGLFTRKAR